nr:hypothetical protein MEP433_gp8 [Methylophilales phage MEP433]
MICCGIAKYWFTATTKKTSMSSGNMEGWFANLNNAPNCL